jgi:ribosomal subunit interface protein
MLVRDNIKFFFKGVKIDERTEEYVEKRLGAIDKLLKNILTTEVEIEVDKKGKFRVEFRIRTPYNDYRAEEISESIEGSADMAVEELKNQIAKRKGRREAMKKRGAASIKKKMVLDKSARF